MEYQKFIPEGWNDTKQNLNLQQLQQAKQNGTIMQGIVEKCDENFNLQINLNRDIIGVIPRNEIDIVSQDDFGMTKPSICKNKVNQLVQFKVKEIYDENHLILSRKQVGKEALDWAKNELQAGMIVKRNCEKYSKVWRFH